MMASYQLQPEAEKDLEDIWRHTLKTWGVDQAMAYIDALDGAFQFLADNPHVNRKRTEFAPAVQIHPVKKHLIIYIGDAKPLLIIRVFYGDVPHEPKSQSKSTAQTTNSSSCNGLVLQISFFIRS